ncbi:MAG: 4Fe-4S binding protein [Myxococcales bacterium]
MAQRHSRRANFPVWRAPCIHSGANRETEMANKITDECINCGACEPECPNEAISEGEDFYTIDPAKCDECAAKGGEHSCKAVCPTDCIVQA